MLSVSKIVSDFNIIRSLPQVEINLMRSATRDKDPFFTRMVDDFYKDATRRHPKFPLVRNFQYGMALLKMPESAEVYFADIEASARRNVKKAIRNGYTFSKITYNDWRKDISEINRSTPVRQGRQLPGYMMRVDIPPLPDPLSIDPRHEYAYFGVFKDGKLYAYCGCMIAGELISVGSLFGHNDYLSDGIVPMLLVNIVGYCLDNHPSVKYYMYDKYFGAGEAMRRFKRKFNFMPHRVMWKLG